MAIGEKIVEVGLAGASAAIAAFAVFLWNQTEHLEREIGDLRDEIAKIEKTGEVAMFLQRECETLGAKMIESKISLDLSVVDEIKNLMNNRGCFVAKEPE